MSNLPAAPAATYTGLLKQFNALKYLYNSKEDELKLYRVKDYHASEEKYLKLQKELLAELDINEKLTNEIESLEKEVTHWKANHSSQVQKARVLIERTDLPLERVRAYEYIGLLENTLKYYQGIANIVNSNTTSTHWKFSMLTELIRGKD